MGCYETGQETVNEDSQSSTVFFFVLQHLAEKQLFRPTLKLSFTVNFCWQVLPNTYYVPKLLDKKGKRGNGTNSSKLIFIERSTSPIFDG